MARFEPDPSRDADLAAIASAALAEPKAPVHEDDDMPICELLDRLLDKGVVIGGELTISVADIELLAIGLQVVAGSVERITSPRKPGGAA